MISVRVFFTVFAAGRTSGLEQAFAHVTPRSVGCLLVLLGKLGEESHPRFRKKKKRCSLD